LKVVLQRVLKSGVVIEDKVEGAIEKGLLILLGIEDKDGVEDIVWLTNKILNLRIFDDEQGVMNRSLVDIEGDVLLISQFTLHASTKRGNRPSYILAAKPDIAIPIYKSFINHFEKEFGREIQTGKFGADMKVSLINDGPVTVIIDSKDRK